MQNRGGAKAAKPERVLIVGFRSLDTLKANRCPGRELVAIDVEPDSVEKANAECQRIGWDDVTIRHASILRIPEDDESFDRVLCHCVLHEVRDLGGAFAEMARILRRDGVLEIADFTRIGWLAFRRYRRAACLLLGNAAFLDVHRGFRRRPLKRLLRESGFQPQTYERLDQTWTLGDLRVPPFHLLARRR